MKTVTLGSSDPASFRLIFTLEEVGADYALRAVDLNALEQWSELHRQRSPLGSIPLLEDGDLAMDASDLAILYIAEQHPEARLIVEQPNQLYDSQDILYQLDRLMLDQGNLLNWMAAENKEHRDDYFWRLAQVSGRPKVTGWTAVIRDAIPFAERPLQAAEDIASGLKQVSALLSKQEYLLGARFSIADIGAYSLVRSLAAVMPVGERPQDYPAIAAWMDKVAMRPAAARALGRLKDAGILAEFSPPRDNE